MLTAGEKGLARSGPGCSSSRGTPRSARDNMPKRVQLNQGSHMRLHSTITSPYARKVWVVAHETGLAAKIERIPTNPHADEYLRDDNPLCRVPTLVLADGSTLFDSPVICEYLDSLHDGQKLFPPYGPERWSALRLQGLGDGMLDASLSRRMEVIRPSNEQSPAWIERQIKGVNAACAWLEARAQILGGPITIGHIAVGCALGYLDLRFADDPWRDRYPRLADWCKIFAARPSMVATRYDVLKESLPTSLVKEGPSRH
jgi:glutathione S-transferase